MLWVMGGEEERPPLPPAKATEDVEGGAEDHPGQHTTHIQDKSRGVGTWTSQGPELARKPPKLSGALGHGYRALLCSPPLMQPQLVTSSRVRHPPPTPTNTPITAR